MFHTYIYAHKNSSKAVNRITVEQGPLFIIWICILKNEIGYSTMIIGGLLESYTSASHVLQGRFKAQRTFYTVRTMTRLRAGLPGFNSLQGKWWEYFSLPPRPHPIWGPLILLTNCYREFYPRW